MRLELTRQAAGEANHTGFHRGIGDISILDRFRRRADGEHRPAPGSFEMRDHHACAVKQAHQVVAEQILIERLFDFRQIVGVLEAAAG